MSSNQSDLLAADNAHAQSLSRRDFLWNQGGGLGAVALAWLINRDNRSIIHDGIFTFSIKEL